MPTSKRLSHLIDFNIDYYLNPYIPHNRLYILPKPISHWLGYRTTTPSEPPATLRWPITFLATVAGLCLIGGILNHSPGFLAWHSPVLVASLGATAVLDFNCIRSPLSQPRNTIVGNTLAAICGVAISKLFQHASDFKRIEWVSAAVGCAVANFVMDVTGTVHPPGGATAVIASIDAVTVAIGWRYVPLVLMASVLMVVVGLIFNNILRQYPVYWWAAGNVGSELRRQRAEEKEAEEGKAGESKEGEGKAEERETARKASSDVSSERTLRRELSQQTDQDSGSKGVQLWAAMHQLPSDFELTTEEVAVLQKIQSRVHASK